MIYEVSEDITNNNENINNIAIEIMEGYTTVSNREALKDKIHEIHNYLRNNGAGYNMNALKVFNIIYGLKRIEENNLIDKIGLKRPDCEFSHLLKLANENKDEELTELILNSVLDSVHENKIGNLLFYEIPKNIKSKAFSHLIKEINKITKLEETCNVQLSGKIYEYFVGRDQSAISELGAYFTDRHIVNYIYDKIKPKLNKDKSIKKMIDMFGGSGGFTTGYINYLNTNFDINWENEINKIYHFDINLDVIKSAGLEIFCLTNELPNMRNNINYKNAFTDEYEDMKYELIVTNPPYGGDKIIKSQMQIKTEKIKEYIKKELKTLEDKNKIKQREKQLKLIEKLIKKDKQDSEKMKVCLENCSMRIKNFAKKYKLKANDKEACSLILLMDMLEEKGTCVGVLKEGVFFNKIYKDLRNCLINNFNVKEVISIPQDQFENTSTKTSIIIFDNTKEKTKEVVFSELIVEQYEEDVFEEINENIVITENKGDIKKLYEKVISVATLEDLNNNSIHSLNGKDYNGKKKIYYNKDYELKKLGDICKFMPKSKRKASDGKDEGEYNFYTSSNTIKKCDKADYNEESLIIGSGGVANIKIDNNFSCSADNFIISSMYNKYIYYILKSNMKLLENGFTGSTLKHLSKEYLENLEIPIPKSEDKLKEIVDKISEPFDEKNEKQEKIKKLEDKVKNKIKDIIENEDCEELKLSNICKINYGKRITQKNNTFGTIPVYGGGDITFYTNVSNREKNTLIISRYAMSKTCCRLINKDFYLNDSGLSLECVDKTLQNYINYYFMTEKIQTYIYENCTSGSIQRNLNMNLFENLQIPIPKNKKLIQKLEKTFNEIEKIQEEVKFSEELYNQYISDLSKEIFNNKTNLVSNIKEEKEEIKENIKDSKKLKKKNIKKITKSESDDDFYNSE
jgi:type I restriction-modification system DNA methylase subunit